MTNNSFESLTPEIVISTVEQAIGEPMSGLAAALPSYINRVYELQSMQGERIIAKFYRPDRWDYEAIADEHEFVFDCAEHEIPVITPNLFPDHDSIHYAAGLYFTTFPKQSGRELELNTPEDWNRLGQVIGRMHNVGAKDEASGRMTLTPAKTTEKFIDYLLAGDFISGHNRKSFTAVCRKIVKLIGSRFDDFEFIRIHGDCHRANILDRPDLGLMIIDFDDMMNGTPVQDLWLLLPEHIQNCQDKFYELLDGYCMFRDFDDRSIKLIEPLRIMRMIYFLSWCAFQSRDHKFQHNFPDWGSDQFWRNEINDLEKQYSIIVESDKIFTGYL